MNSHIQFKFKLVQKIENRVGEKWEPSISLVIWHAILDSRRLPNIIFTFVFTKH